MKTSYGISFRNNSIVLSGISEKTAGKVALYSGAGRLITSLTLANLHSGQQAVTLPELGTGMYLLKITLGNESFTRSLVCMGEARYLGDVATASGSNGLHATKKTASATIADTLIATLDTYDTTRYALTTYSKTGIEIVMKKKGTGGFTITSTAFKDGDKMPDKYTCNKKTMGAEPSPPLQWSGAPEGTKSYAMTFLDVTILAAVDPTNAYHWAMWNVPSTVTQLTEGFDGNLYKQKSSFGTKFFGPCPGGKKDTYAFTLYAFDKETINPGNNANVQALVSFFSKNAIDSTKISIWSEARSSGF